MVCVLWFVAFCLRSEAFGLWSVCVVCDVRAQWSVVCGLCCGVWPVVYLLWYAVCVLRFTVYDLPSSMKRSSDDMKQLWRCDAMVQRYEAIL